MVKVLVFSLSFSPRIPMMKVLFFLGHFWSRLPTVKVFVFLGHFWPRIAMVKAFVFSWSFLAKVTFIGHFGYEYQWWRLCLWFEILINLWHPLCQMRIRICWRQSLAPHCATRSSSSRRQLLAWHCKCEYTHTPVGKFWQESTTISYPGMERVKLPSASVAILAYLLLNLAGFSQY